MSERNARVRTLKPVGRLQAKECDRLEGAHKAAGEPGQSREEMRALAAHLMTVQEDDCRRLSRELHDDFGQRVAILSIHADRALEQVHTNPQESEELLRSIREELLALNHGLREVSHRLHPSVIEDLGLIAALRSLSVSYRENGSEVSCRFVDEIPELPLDTATALYRIAQEALRNAQKHGEGTPIYISLTITESTLQLAVCDTGPGFDPAHAQHDSGLGLLTMHERARLVNGTLMVRSQPGQGTVVSVIVPL